MTDEPNAEAAADTSPAPAPIDAVPPIPAPAEAEVAAEATAFEEPPETVPPVETPAFVDEADASASEQPAAMDDRTATPALENILVSVTKENPFFKEPTTFVRENLDAMVHSSNAASAGLEALGQEIADFGWRRFDEAFDAWKGLLQSRSPVERFQRQCDYARSALDDILGESSKVTLAVIKLAGEVSQPVTRRFAGAIDRSSR